MSVPPIRVGIIGAAPDRGWAASAHIPALKALPQFALTAVCTTRQESADATARKFGIPVALADPHALVRHPDVDLVIVTTKVGAHRALVGAALDAGKHLFCEWPLALDAAEAEAMLAAARHAGVRHMVGLQDRVHPVLKQVRAMVAGGEIGRLLSVSLISSLASWGPRLPAAEAYRADRANGATGLTVPGGHSLDAVQFCFGAIAQVSAIVTTQHPETEIIGTAQTVKVTSPDQVLLSARLAGGAVLSAHIKADMAVPMGVRLEVNGSEGDLLLVARTPSGQDPVGIQRAELVLSRARRGTRDYVAVPAPANDGVAPGIAPGPAFYTARLLARLAEAIRTGGPSSPDFADGLAGHRLLEAVQRASDSGRMQEIEA